MSVKIETENVEENEVSAELVRELMAALGRAPRREVKGVVETLRN